LVEYAIDLTIITVVSIIGVVGLVFGGIWANLKKNDPHLFKDKENSYKETVTFLRAENNRLNGTISKQRQKFQTDDNYDLNDEGDLASLAKSLLPQFVEFLPQDVQKHAKGLLSNPDVVDLLEEIHKRFPKETKALFSGFIKGGKSTQPSSTPELTNQYDPRGA